jgi:hypothetical protein
MGSAEILKRVDRAEVRKTAEGWRTSLFGTREDGSKAREDSNTRITEEMALKDIPQGVETKVLMRLLKAHQRSKGDIPAGTEGEIILGKYTPIKDHRVVRFEGYGTYHVRDEDIGPASKSLEG